MVDQTPSRALTVPRTPTDPSATTILFLLFLLSRPPDSTFVQYHSGSPPLSLDREGAEAQTIMGPSSLGTRGTAAQPMSPLLCRGQIGLRCQNRLAVWFWQREHNFS